MFHVPGGGCMLSIPSSNAGEIETEKKKKNGDAVTHMDEEWSGTPGHGWVWYNHPLLTDKIDQ